MSSFGDGNNKTRIEENLSYIIENYYLNFQDSAAVQKEFLVDVMAVLMYLCGEW